MRYIFPPLVFIVILTLWHATSEGAAPYGDYCQWCSAYGICKDDLGQQEAVDIIEKYFASKGMTAVIIRHNGRFVEVEIYNHSFNHSRPFDKILFDRRTGRCRSTY